MSTANIFEDEEFQALHRANIDAYYDLRQQVQFGELLMALGEVREQCPDIESFTLDVYQTYVSASEGTDARRNFAPVEQQEALCDIFATRDVDDYTMFAPHVTVDIAHTIEQWRDLIGSPASE